MNGARYPTGMFISEPSHAPYPAPPAYSESPSSSRAAARRRWSACEERREGERQHGGENRGARWGKMRIMEKNATRRVGRGGLLCSLEFVVDALEQLVALARGGGEGARHAE